MGSDRQVSEPGSGFGSAPDSPRGKVSQGMLRPGVARQVETRLPMAGRGKVSQGGLRSVMARLPAVRLGETGSGLGAARHGWFPEAWYVAWFGSPRSGSAWQARAGWAWAWFPVARRGKQGLGLVCPGPVRFGPALARLPEVGLVKVRFGQAWCGFPRPGMAWFVLVWRGWIWLPEAWYVKFWLGRMRYGTAGLGATW